MSDQSISEIIFTMMSLLFLLLGVVLLVSIVMSTINPYDQIAFANVEKLRAGMNEACFASNDVNMKFDLPQNTPMLASLVPVMPIWIIRSNGDPNYVLYYESFPVGDATGWEIYHWMQNRVVVPLPNGDNKNSDYVNEYASTIRSEWSAKVANDNSVQLDSKNLEGVIINNVVLNKELQTNYYTDQGSSTPAASGATSGSWENEYTNYGDWKKKDTNGVPEVGDNTYELKNYRALTPFEKTAIKYMPCGTNSLCLKTRSGVYKFPMEQCNGIKYIELKYDARNRKTIYAAAGITVAVVAAGWVVLGAGGAVVGTVGASGEIPAAVFTAATTSTAWAPGTVAVAPASGQAATFALADFATATSTTATLYTTPAATSAASGTFATVLRFLASKGWGIAKGFVGLIMKLPFPIPSAVGAGALGGAGVATYKVGEFIAGAFLSYKVGDFNIESSCSIKSMTIKQVDCRDLDCTRFISYPIYEYRSDGKLHDTNQKHYTCVEKIFGVNEQTYQVGPFGVISPSSSFGQPKNSVFTDSDNCLQVIVEEKTDGFCWTPDPYKESWFSDTQYVANSLQFFPIKQSTTFLPGSESAVVLEHYPMGKLESWKDYLERRLAWGWPG